MADLRAAWTEVRHLRALVKRAHFKGAAGAGGGFFKDQGDVFPDQRLLFASGFFGGLQFDGKARVWSVPTLITTPSRIWRQN
jgi:hypothetical protein